VTFGEPTSANWQFSKAVSIDKVGRSTRLTVKLEGSTTHLTVTVELPGRLQVL
jgi:hypothetical protein